MPSQEAIRRFCQDAPERISKGFRKDAEALPFLERQLTETMAEVFETLYPELVMIEGGVIPIDTSVSEGANFFEYIMMDGTTLAQFVTSYAGDDMPMVSISAARHATPIHTIQAGFEYSYQDMRAAVFANVPLTSELGDLCRRGHMEKHNRVALWGSKKRKLDGFVNHKNVPELAPLPDPDLAGETRWAVKNPILVAQDIANMIARVRKTTKRTHRVTHLAMGTETFEVLQGRPMSVSTAAGIALNSESVMSWLQKVHPSVTFVDVPELMADESEGNLDSNVAIAYQGGDKRIVSYVMPMDFTMHEPQWRGLKAQVPCESRSGGVVWRYPLSGLRMRRV